MSSRSLHSIGGGLPPPLRAQVLGYAAAVEEASKDIANQAGVAWTPAFAEKLAFLAGVKRLFDIVASAHWSLKNSSELLTMGGAPRITIAGKDYSRDSEIYRDIGKLLLDLETVLIQQGVMEAIRLPYEELAEWIANESR